MAKGALTHHLQGRTACKIENDRQGAPKWPTGSGKVPTPRFLGAPANFCYISFLIQAQKKRENNNLENKENKSGSKDLIQSTKA